ncbi:MAG: hypothetical protein NT156_08590 [Mycobacterium sp.]|nr:hypothetical protein [Mycobacterium sp.]
MRTALLASVTILGVLVGAVAIAGFIRFDFTSGGDVVSDRKSSPEISDLTITIDTQEFAMSDGVAVIPPSQGSATANTLRLIDVGDSDVGDSDVGDSDGDGNPDAALLVQHDPGGSGTFYYAVVAINDGGSYRASNALLLGDRIEPRAVEFADGRFVYTYAERKPGDSMSERGTVEKSVTVTVDNSASAISSS